MEMRNGLRVSSIGEAIQSASVIKEQFVKKSLLLAISAATLSTAAYAESSVTLYGIIDTGIGYAKVDVLH